MENKIKFFRSEDLESENIRKQIEAGIERLDEFGSLGLVEGVAACQRRLHELRAEVERLREALELAEVEMALERTWCRICRTEWRSNGRNRKGHPHAAGCVLARATPLVTEDKTNEENN
jgi:hypothetical protein